jgi:RNA recognition motif-containing protein
MSRGHSPPRRDPSLPASHSDSKEESLPAVSSGSGPLPPRIFVGNLPFHAVTSNLQDLFSTCGDIISLRPLSDRGMACIQYATREAAEAAISRFHKSDFQGRELSVSFGQMPSRKVTPRATKRKDGSQTEVPSGFTYGDHLLREGRIYRKDANLIPKLDVMRSTSHAPTIAGFPKITIPLGNGSTLWKETVKSTDTSRILHRR